MSGTSRTLTKVLLKKDFGLEWDLPDTHLAPGLPGRINYLNWVHEVLKILTKDTSEVTGIDIGTGASCIYPLLGHSLYKWKFIATDIDPESVQCAKENVERNGLEQWITVCQRTDEQPLLEGVSPSPVDFSMCNPPFFSSVEEVVFGRRCHAERGQSANRLSGDGRRAGDGRRRGRLCAANDLRIPAAADAGPRLHVASGSQAFAARGAAAASRGEGAQRGLDSAVSGKNLSLVRVLVVRRSSAVTL